MKRLAVSMLVAALALPGTANAQFRRQPSPLPPPAASPSVDYGRGSWDTRTQDQWDRTLRRCLNDRRQNKRERRRCADSGMPPRR